MLNEFSRRNFLAGAASLAAATRALAIDDKANVPVIAKSPAEAGDHFRLARALPCNRQPVLKYANSGTAGMAPKTTPI